jgi:hypothetical protein
MRTLPVVPFNKRKPRDIGRTHICLWTSKGNYIGLTYSSNMAIIIIVFDAYNMFTVSVRQARGGSTPDHDLVTHGSQGDHTPSPNKGACFSNNVLNTDRQIN